MASYSRCSLSDASQGSTAGTAIVSRFAAPPNMSFCPTETASWVRWAVDIMASTAAWARARFGSSVSKAPAAARLSMIRLLIACLLATFPASAFAQTPQPAQPSDAARALAGPWELSNPDRDRRCLLLRAEGLRYRDIAGTLGMSLGGVAKSLARSIARLVNVDRG